MGKRTRIRDVLMLDKKLLKAKIELMTRSVFQTLSLECRRFDVEAEITAKILRAGFTIKECSISYNARYDNKKLSPLDGLPTLRALVKYRFLS